MPNFTNPLAWDAKERLKHIEKCLWWLGKVNRSDLSMRFSISLPQASSDIQKYQLLNPGSIEYCLKVKRYIPSRNFNPIFIDLFDFEDALDTFLNHQEHQNKINHPSRISSVEKLRSNLRAIHAKNILEITYCSLHSNTLKRRKIAPHSICSDGFRWHVRAWCYENKEFRDFLPGRMTKITQLNQPAVQYVDVLWNSWVELSIIANPELDAYAIQSIEMDYCMEDGLLHIHTRKAMRGYSLRMLQFKEDSFVGQTNNNHLLFLKGEEEMN